ncbi:MAG: membrane protein insertase YidC [Bacilli bacterium]|nr:membrane protein insertase YidC [Bacilli bacterium]
MKQFKHKKLLAIGGFALGAVLLASCTANFCSPVDQAAMAYPTDQGVTVFVSTAEYETINNADATKDLIAKEEQLSAEAKALGLPTLAGPAFLDDDGNVLNDNVYKYVPLTANEDSNTYDLKTLNINAYKTTAFLKDFVSNVSKSGYTLPSLYYYAAIDDYALRAATVTFFSGADYTYAGSADFVTKLDSFKDKLLNVVAGSEESLPEGYVAVNPYKEVDPTENPTEIPSSQSILRQGGHVKFGGRKITAEGKVETPLLGHLTEWNNELRDLTSLGFSQLGIFDVPGADYLNYYANQITAKVNTVRSCIATRDGEFGHYGTFADWRVAIEQKDWGYAWSKGFLEGLLVYPVTWVLDSLSYSFDPALTGVGQIWALIIVTLIVRGLLLAVGFRTTLDNQKMQALQPELAKLQQKYPNANTNQAEKQALSQAQMKLYRQHGIKPFRQLIVMIVQFPVFICVWAGLQGSAALSTGEFLNMRLSDNINSILFNTKGTWYANTTGWWTALILFILMAATQIMAMVLPRIMAKKNTKNVAKMNKSNSQTQQNSTMKMVSYGLIIFTIIMGFFLPSAMGIYWLIGGLISMVQTLITQLIISKNKKGR